MAYFESITAGRGGLDSYNQALNNQRYANLLLNESMGNFANTIANAGSLFDNAKLREEAVKYQRMRDLANDKKQAEAVKYQRMRDLANDKKQAEALKYQRMRDLANDKKQAEAVKYQRMRDLANDKKQAEAFDLQKRQAEQSMDFAKKQNAWLLMAAKPNAKTSVTADNNNAMKTTPTPTTPTTLNANNTQSAPKPKTISKEEFKAIYANPMFRF